MRKICHLVLSNLGGLKNLEGIADALKPPSPPPVKRTQKGPDTTMAGDGQTGQASDWWCCSGREASKQGGWM